MFGESSFVGVVLNLDFLCGMVKVVMVSYVAPLDEVVTILCTFIRRSSSVVC